MYVVPVFSISNLIYGVTYKIMKHVLFRARQNKNNHFLKKKLSSRGPRTV